MDKKTVRIAGIATAAALIAAGAAWQAAVNYRSYQAELDTYLDMPAPKSVLDNLCGKYTAILPDGEYCSALVSYDEYDRYQVRIHSRKGIKTHSFGVFEGNFLTSETLGNGTAMYREHIKKVILTFEKDSRQCILERL